MMEPCTNLMLRIHSCRLSRFQFVDLRVIRGKTLIRVEFAATLRSGTNADDRLSWLMMRHEGHESHEEGRQDLEKIRFANLRDVRDADRSPLPKIAATLPSGTTADNRLSWLMMEPCTNPMLRIHSCRLSRFQFVDLRVIRGKTLIRVEFAATLRSGTNADDWLSWLMMRHEGHESHEEGRQDLEKIRFANLRDVRDADRSPLPKIAATLPSGTTADNRLSWLMMEPCTNPMLRIPSCRLSSFQFVDLRVIRGKTLIRVEFAATLPNGTNADDRLRRLMMRHEGHERHEEGQRDLEKT